MTTIAVLRQLPLFADVDERVLRRFAEQCVTRVHPPGFVLFTTGEPCQGLYIGSPYPASAVTLEESELIFLPRAEFERAYRADPDFAHLIVRALGRRLRQLIQLTETLAFRDVAKLRASSFGR